MADVVNQVRARPNWRQRLRTLIVSRGSQVMCGSGNYAAIAETMDISLVGAGARLAWLRILGAFGVKSFVTTSGLGYNFVCHIGDLANFPFYYRRAYQTELELCVAWLQGQDSPVIFDIGANDGFFSTHLAQMLARSTPKIYAFEPVPTTFARLAESVRGLGLHDSVHAVAAAVVDNPGAVRISYSKRNSLLAQVSSQGLNPRAGDVLVEAEGVTLEGYCSLVGAVPKLLKIDVEGSEVAVLRDAKELLSGPDRPAILLEFNPVALMERGSSAHALLSLLPGYTLHYVDDLIGQKRPFGSLVPDAEQIDWICNLFAVPLTEWSARRWASILEQPGRASIP